MYKTDTGRALALVTALASTPFAVQLAAADKEIKLSGCLVRGEDGDGYLLRNAPGEPASQRTTDANVTPSAVGTAGAFASIFYWLDGDDDLQKHVGHLVEIEGELGSELQEGAIKIDRKDDWTELEVEADGDHLKARVPHASVFGAPGRDNDREVNVLVRRVDVESVKMLGATCR